MQLTRHTALGQHVAAYPVASRSRSETWLSIRWTRLVLVWATRRF